ncbi:restriction endonuclease subunit S [Bacteroides pyogenes]|uniref:CRISPR-associated protein, TM1814 family n=2 Tax=Bacteroides pyogenes TaxID=310300 RepID=W4PG36_9BACE|nr:restriction endonuclease subunit S [Bacteroides pyogenes]GAE18119.1 CRISPR-associated protein, TM1814 family [Bacteroides pyogenes DSM 20611 = JCM 6294]
MKEPKIRFKGFSGEWEETPFSETFDSLKNNSLSRAELSDSGEVMNIHYGDVLIKYGECVDVIKEVETFVKDEEVAKKLHQSCAIKNGDVIFADAAEDNTVGKCSEVIANKNDAIVSGLHTIACRPKKDFAPMYLGYYLNSNAYHDQLLPHIQGTKISSISKKAISQTEISSPIDKNEQQSVASYFHHLDVLIQSTTKKIESLKQVKAASLQSMFPQEGETTPRVRFKGFEGEWEETTIGKVTSVKRGIRVTRKNLSDHGLYPVYQNTDYPMGYYNRYNVESNNPFVIIGGSAGLIGFCDKDFWAADDCAYFCDSVKLDKSYLYRMLLNKNSEIKKNVRGSSVPRLDRQVINDLNIVLPSIAEQRAIASYFTNLDRQITLQSQRLEKLKQIKAACLDNMFV